MPTMLGAFVACNGVLGLSLSDALGAVSLGEVFNPARPTDSHDRHAVQDSRTRCRHRDDSKAHRIRFIAENLGPETVQTCERIKRDAHHLVAVAHQCASRSVIRELGPPTTSTLVASSKSQEETKGGANTFRKVRDRARHEDDPWVQA